MTQRRDPRAHLFFEQLLQRMAVLEHPNSHWQTQIACGRWLGIRRLQQDMRIATLASRTGIAPEAIEVLEAGVANSTVVSPLGAVKLAIALGNGPEEQQFIACVVTMAIGQAPVPVVLNSVLADLQRDTSDPRLHNAC